MKLKYLILLPLIACGKVNPPNKSSFVYSDPEPTKTQVEYPDTQVLQDEIDSLKEQLKNLQYDRDEYQKLAFDTVHKFNNCRDYLPTMTSITRDLLPPDTQFNTRYSVAYVQALIDASYEHEDINYEQLNKYLEQLGGESQEQEAEEQNEEQPID